MCFGLASKGTAVSFLPGPRYMCRYEKARKLKDYIDDIRATYQRNWDSKDRQERQASAPADA